MKIRNRIKELRRIRAGDLVANPLNWRTHPAEQREALQGMLEDIGYADALIGREDQDGRVHLIDGHLRAETTPDTEVPVLITDLTKEEADKILLTLDPLAAMAGRDDDKLQALADKFESESDALLQMVQDLSGLAGASFDDPAMPEPSGGKAITKAGDLWTLGRHRLLCGEPQRKDDVDRATAGSAPFMAITAPPAGETGGWLEHYKPAVAYLWHRAETATATQDQLTAAGFETRAQIIWARTDRDDADEGYGGQHEACWYGVRTGHSSRWRGDRKQSTVWPLPSGPAGRPIDCMARPMMNHDKVGGFVWDPFGGDGATLLAAEQADRCAVLMERDPAACDTIVERWQTLTGQEATRA